MYFNQSNVVVIQLFAAKNRVDQVLLDSKLRKWLGFKFARYQLVLIGPFTLESKYLPVNHRKTADFCSVLTHLNEKTPNNDLEFHFDHEW